VRATASSVETAMVVTRDVVDPKMVVVDPKMVVVEHSAIAATVLVEDGTLTASHHVETRDRLHRKLCLLLQHICTN
jgi:hypothetical protein